MHFLFAILFTALCAQGSAGVEGAPTDSLDATRAPEPSDSSVVDLSGNELPALPQSKAPTHLLAKPWYQNVELSGFAAFWLADSGADGTRPEAGFVIKESSLFLEADAWQDLALFFEIQTTGLQRDHSTSLRTGEVYAHFRNALKKWGDGLLGIKVGRTDIPFGEEYLWQDAPDNPLISNSAAYPWLWDEGIVFYGSARGLDWVLAVMDGTISRSQEDDAAKAVIGKISVRPWQPLHLSVSLLRNGASQRAALLLGGTPLQPVDGSPNARVGAMLYQFDAQWTPGPQTRFDLSFGRAAVDDAADAFDRDLTWFMLQGRRTVAHRFHIAARYSEIGTYDDEAGYKIDGEFLAGGGAFAFDVQRLRRISLGLGWQINPHSGLKLEAGRDTFELIAPSPFDASGDERNHLVAELHVSF